MSLRRPIVRIGGVFKELPVGDTLPTLIPATGAAGQVLTKNSATDYDMVWALPGALRQFATSGDLSASPAALVTFLGLDAYTFIHFDFAAVGHDYTTASQNFSLQVSLDGTTWGGAVAFSPTISSGSRNHGHLQILANGANKPRIQCGMTTGNTLAVGTVSGTVEAPRMVWGSGKIVGVRFLPTTSGNFNTGVITALGN